MRLLLLGFLSGFLVYNTGYGQTDSAPPGVGTHPGWAWIVPVGVVASSTVDGEMREWALHSHSRSFDRLAHAIDPLGTAHVLLPAMVVFYAGAALTHETGAEHAAIETVAAYAASDAVESILKPIIGRQRPHVSGNSHRFQPFTTNGDWHSLPSAHVAHITAIATALSMETDSRPLIALCSSIAALVSWDRIYEDQHWTSDVTATAALSAFISRTTVRWVKSHWSQ